jgi:hypothetical protein
LRLLQVGTENTAEDSGAPIPFDHFALFESGDIIINGIFTISIKVVIRSLVLTL